jgi:hypothetical protein
MPWYHVPLVMAVLVEAAGPDDVDAAAIAEAAAKQGSQGMSCLLVQSVEEDEPMVSDP